MVLSRREFLQSTCAGALLYATKPLEVLAQDEQDKDKTALAQARILEFEEKVRDAENAYQKLSEGSSVKAQANYRLHVLYARVAPDTSERLLFAPERHGKGPELSSCRAVLRYHQGKKEEAEQYADQTVQTEENLKRETLVQTLKEKGLTVTPDTRLDVSKLTLVGEPFAVAHWIKGMLYSDAQNYKRAEKEFSISVTQDPTNTAYLNYLGLTYQKCGKIEQAQKTLEGALELSPTSLLVLRNLAVIAYNNQDREKARSLVQKCLEINPESESSKQLLEQLK